MNFFRKSTRIKRILSGILAFLLGIQSSSLLSTPPVAAAPNVVPAVVETLENVASKVPPELLLLGAQNIVVVAGVAVAAHMIMQPELPECHAEARLAEIVKQEWANSTLISDTVTQLGDTVSYCGDRLVQLADIMPDSETQEIMQLVQWSTGMTGQKVQEETAVASFSHYTIPECSLLKQLDSNRVNTLLKDTENITNPSVTQPDALDKTPPAPAKVPAVTFPKPVYHSQPSPKPVLPKNPRSFNTLITSDGKKLNITILNSPATGKERAQRMATLLDQRSKNQLQSAKIAAQCRNSERRINARLFLQDACARDPQFAAQLNKELQKILDIFEAATQLSTTPEVIAKQLELAHYPNGYEISEKFPGFAENFRTTIYKLHYLMFNSDGRFAGITTPAQQQAAAEIYAGLLHKISFDSNRVFQPTKYLQYLKAAVDKGLPGFKKLYEDALKNPKLSQWKCSQSIGWFQSPASHAQKIAEHTFNNDLKVMAELLATDKNDNCNSFAQCADVLNKYKVASQLQGKTSSMNEAQEQYKFLSEFFNNVNDAIYNLNGIRHEFWNDPLAKRLGNDIAKNQITQHDANILLQQRDIAKTTFVHRLGLANVSIPQALSEILYDALDRSYDLGLMTEYVVTQISCDSPDKSKSEVYPLLFNNQGVCCILPADMSRLRDHVLPQAINTERCTTERVALNHLLRAPIANAQEAALVDHAIKSLINACDKDNPHAAVDRKVASYITAALFDHDKTAALAPFAHLVEKPTQQVRDILPDNDPGTPPQFQATLENKPFARTIDLLKDYVQKNPYKVVELAGVSAYMYDNYNSSARMFDDYCDDYVEGFDEDDVVELCENMFGDYLTKEQLDDLIEKLKGTMLFKDSGNGNGSGNGGNNGGNGSGGNGDDPQNRGYGKPTMPSKPPKLSPLLAAMYKFWNKNKQKYDNVRGTKIRLPKVEGAKIPKNQRYSSKNAQHNYKHYFSPDVKIKSKNKLNISGFHSNRNGMFNKIIEMKDVTKYKHDFYTARWKYGNSGYKFSTFWPDKWSHKKILKKIREAYSNQIQKPVWENGTILVKGRIKEGYDVVIVYEADLLTRLATGKIITAYPVIKDLL